MNLEDLYESGGNRKVHASLVNVLTENKYLPTIALLEGCLNSYLLLTEFEVRIVSYGPSSFFPSFMAQAGSTRATNRRGKNEDP